MARLRNWKPKERNVVIVEGLERSYLVGEKNLPTEQPDNEADIRIRKANAKILLRDRMMGTRLPPKKESP